MSAIPCLVISNTLLPQSHIMAAFVHSHSNLFSDVSPVLPTYSNQNVTQFTVYSIRSLACNLFIFLLWLHKKYICCYIPKHYTNLEVHLFVIRSDMLLKIENSLNIYTFYLWTTGRNNYIESANKIIIILI